MDLSFGPMTYSDAKASDFVGLTPADDPISQTLIMRLSISHHHHHLAGSRATTMPRKKSLVSDTHTHTKILIIFTVNLSYGQYAFIPL